MKTPEKLNNQSVSLLLSAIKEEFSAFYFYRSCQNWCANVGFKLFAAYFEKESIAELQHVKDLEQYLVDWNIDVALPQIDAPESKFLNLVDIIEKAYDKEFKLLTLYTDTANNCLQRNDQATYKVLQAKIQTQVDSVKEYSDMLNMLQGVDIRDKFQLLLLEEKLVG